MDEPCSICGPKMWYPHMKTHYFVFNAGIVAVIPFIQVLGKQLEVSEMTMGLIYTVLPFVTFLAKLSLGWIADYTKSIQRIAYIILFALSLCCCFINFIPRRDHHVTGFVQCNSNGTVYSYRNISNATCVRNIKSNKEYYCFMKCWECAHLNKTTLFDNSKCGIGQVMRGTMMIEPNASFPLGLFDIRSIQLDGHDRKTTCGTTMNFECETTCEPEVHDCYDENKGIGAGLLQILPFAVAVIIVNSSAGIISTLGDAICFHILGTNSHLYGKQRLFGTLGWGVVSPIVGILNSIITGASFLQSLTFGFYLATVFFLIDILVLRNIRLQELSLSKNIFKDIGIVLRKVEIILFLISMFMMGAFIGLLWTFFYWHLLDLKASVLLLGIANAVETIVGELPFFYFASKIIRTIGHFNALTISFASFGLRFIAISYVVNPWWILPFEVLQGPTFGLFYATMASYANYAALPGTEATMQGLIGGVFEGLGLAAGSFLSSLSMQRYKGSLTFYGAGIIALLYAVVNTIFSVCVTNLRKRAELKAKLQAVESPGEHTVFL